MEPTTKEMKRKIVEVCWLAIVAQGQTYESIPNLAPLIDLSNEIMAELNSSGNISHCGQGQPQTPSTLKSTRISTFCSATMSAVSTTRFIGDANQLPQIVENQSFVLSLC